MGDGAGQCAAFNIFPLRRNGSYHRLSARARPLGQANGGDFAGDLCVPGAVGILCISAQPDNVQSDDFLPDNVGIGHKCKWLYPLPCMRGYDAQGGAEPVTHFV